jgi:acyl-CoA thioesterase-1
MNQQLVGILLILLRHAEPVILPPEPPPPPPPPPPPKETVVCFGDSITAGYKAIGYPTYLQSMKSSSLNVVNAGLGGEDTYHGVARMKKVLAANRPKYVVIMEGANDVVEGISPSTTTYDLNNMALQVKRVGGIPIMSTITPNTARRSYVPENYNPSIILMAYRGRFTLVDTYSRMVSSWRSITFDGIHPNDTGSQMIAEGFAEALTKVQSK